MKKSIWHLTIVAAAIALYVQPGRADLIVLSGALDGGQVFGGPTGSTATGFATVTIDTTLFTITTDLSWTGLSGPADRSHLHDAPKGQATDDVFFHEIFYDDTSVPLDEQVDCPAGLSPVGLTGCAPTTGTAHNVLQLSAGDGYGYADFASLVDVFLSDGVYIDIHTLQYEHGEIRGQLLAVPEPSSLALFAAGMMAFVLLRLRRPA